MNKSKAKGTSFETAVKIYLSEHMPEISELIHRETLHGSSDLGDISGVKTIGKPGLKIAIECKNYGSHDCIPQWLREAEAERENSGSDVGVVVSKRRGIGTKNMGEQLVSMTLDQFIRLIRGNV
jgi:hypothetical protein